MVGEGGPVASAGDDKADDRPTPAMLIPVGDPTTKERIVAEARRSFANHGYEGASLNDIAEGVGIRRPSLLHYFPSKEAMYRHVLEEALLDWSHQIDRARSTEVDDWKVVDRILEVSFEFFRDNPEIVQIVRREALTETGHLGFDLGQALRPYFRRSVAFFEREMKDGRFRQHDPEHLVLTGYGALLTYFSDRAMLTGLLDIDPFSDEALEARFHHMRAFVRAALEPIDGG